MPIFDHKSCPACGADWRDGEGTKLIGIVDPDQDMVVDWQCPACEIKWHRNAKAALRASAQPTPPAAVTERLLDEKNVLLNKYGYGQYMDGLVRQRIEAIDRELARREASHG